MKKGRAFLQLDQYCSIIVDGTVQSAFGIHALSRVLNQRCSRMLCKVKLIGGGQYGSLITLRMFKINEEQGTGEKNIIKTIHSSLQGRSNVKSLPQLCY